MWTRNGESNKKSEVIQKQLKTRKTEILSILSAAVVARLMFVTQNSHRGHIVIIVTDNWMECAMSVCYAVGATDVTAATEAVNSHHRNWLRNSRTFCWMLKILNFARETDSNANVSQWGVKWPNWFEWMRWDRKRFAVSVCILLAFVSDYYTVYWALVGLQQTVRASISCCVWCAHRIVSMIEMRIVAGSCFDQ